MKRRAVLVVLAVVLATIGTVGVYAYVHGADKRASAGAQSAAVVVATKQIDAGTTWKDAVKTGSLEVQQMPQSSASAAAITSLDAGVAQDEVAQGDIAPGSAVLRAAFGVATSQTGVVSIPKGMIAITVSLSSDADVAGYVLPKSQVAVFVTAPLKLKKDAAAPSTSGDDLTVTRVVVSRALVLASSQASPTALVGSSDAAGATSASGVLITLALTQKDAERVINQQKVGTLTLGLLSADSHISQDNGYTNTGVFSPQPIWTR